MSEEKVRPQPPDHTLEELTSRFYSGGITRAEYEAVITPAVAPMNPDPKQPGAPKP